MASKSNLTAVHFTLIMFVMVSIICGVGWYLSFRDVQKLTADITAEKQKASDQQKVARQNDEVIQQLKGRIGHNADNNEAVLTAMSDDIKKYGNNPALNDLSSALKQSNQELETAQTEVQRLRDELDKQRKINRDLITQYSLRENELTRRAEKSEQNLRSVQQQHQETLDVKDQKIADLQQDVNKLQFEAQAMQESHQKEIELLDQKIARYKAINIKLNDEILNIKKTSFEVPDGEIQWVDQVNKIVWINLGEDDKLTKRTTFSVYTKTHHGIARGSEDIKGSIEVTRILGPHQAEARILDRDIYQPITKGDPIYTPLWSSGKAEEFAIVGFVDVDGDGKSDRQLLNDVVANTGASMSIQIDDLGERVNEKGEPTDRPIDVNIKFLVIGEILDPTETALPKDKEILKKVARKRKELVEEARENGTRVVNLNTFLDIVGYKSQRRLWAPGEEIPWKLSAGSRSTAVNATLGQRESSGQVSGRYSRSKRLKQPTSTGQTSKSYSY